MELLNVEDGIMWEDIKDAPIGTEMFVVKTFGVSNGLTGGQTYTSDPWCVWQQKEGEFSRWPHKFPPTHFLRLPTNG
jgi:hypothetical protein